MLLIGFTPIVIVTSNGTIQSKLFNSTVCLLYRSEKLEFSRWSLVVNTHLSLLTGIVHERLYLI